MIPPPPQSISTLVFTDPLTGGEPTRVTLKQWEQAVTGYWLSPPLREKLKMDLEAKKKVMLITYLPGKGNKLVPMLFPSDTINACKYLADKTIRKNNCVSVLYAKIIQSLFRYIKSKT